MFWYTVALLQLVFICLIQESILDQSLTNSTKSSVAAANSKNVTIQSRTLSISIGKVGSGTFRWPSKLRSNDHNSRINAFSAHINYLKKLISDERNKSVKYEAEVELLNLNFDKARSSLFGVEEKLNELKRNAKIKQLNLKKCTAEAKLNFKQELPASRKHQIQNKILKIYTTSVAKWTGYYLKKLNEVVGLLNDGKINHTFKNVLTAMVVEE